MAKTQNHKTVGYGTRDGELKFGHIHEDGVVSAVALRSGHDANHYITLETSGKPHRKNGTICKSSGSFQVQAGDTTPYGQPGIFMDAVNGDIILNAKNGRVRIYAENIDLIAKGADGKNGNINIEANQNVTIYGKQNAIVKSDVNTKIFSEKTVEVIGNGILNIYGGLVDAMDSASTGGLNPVAKGSKTCPIPTVSTPLEITNRLLNVIKDIVG